MWLAHGHIGDPYAQMAQTGQAHEWWYHWKSQELIDANPSGLVPTLVEDTTTSPRAVYESLVTVEFVDAISGAQGTSRQSDMPVPCFVTSLGFAYMVCLFVCSLVHVCVCVCVCVCGHPTLSSNKCG
jgi:hypothetical protein